MRRAAPPVAHDAFRDAMASVCTPVAVVTAMSDDLPFGTTVSAFASLSMDPPMVLVSLARTSDLLVAVGRSGAFGVNVLAHDQAVAATTFARKGGPGKFAGIGWRAEHGQPRLDGAASRLVCSVTEQIDGGDHVVVLGSVHHAESIASPPLTYHRRAFGTHREHRA